MSAPAGAAVRSVLERSAFVPLRHQPHVALSQAVAALAASIDRQVDGGATVITEAGGDAVAVLAPLSFDSRVLGAPVAALSVYAAADAPAGSVAAALRTGLDRAGDDGHRLLVAKTTTDDVRVIHALEAEGFRLMDTQVQYVCDLSTPAAAADAGVRVRLATADDEPALTAVAARAFADHFGRIHADERIDQATATAFYVEWVRACLGGWTDWVGVAEAEDTIVGYAAWKAPEDDAVPVGHHSIAAVDPEWSGRGVFRALVVHGTELLRPCAASIEGFTHVNNTGVRKGYERLGWSIADGRHAFHRWT